MRTILLLAAALVVIPTPASPQAALTRLKGSASQVGVAPRPGDAGGAQVRLQGFILGVDAVDPESIVTVSSLLADRGDELVKGTGGAGILPIVLLPRAGAQPTKVEYESADPRARPSFWLRLKEVRGRLQFRVRVDRATISHHPCPDGGTVNLGSQFQVDSGGSPLLVVFDRQWACSTSQLRMQGSVAPGPVPPPPANERPRAVLDVRLLATDLVELDGGSSHDPDGAIVRYLFDSGDGRVHDGPEAMARFAYAPGDYRAALTVFDDRGAASETATSRFSITAPPAGNEPPTASLRVELLTRTTGEPDLVELDGRSSHDPDGTIVRYLFDSGDGRVHDGPEATARFVYVPGDYRAGLAVFDDQGAASATVTRGFSVK
jgi:hypothetical protein